MTAGYYVYAVVDTRITPHTLISVHLTRKEAREKINRMVGVKKYMRVRYAKLIPFRR